MKTYEKAGTCIMNGGNENPQNNICRKSSGEYLGPKREEVVGGWRWLHNEEFRNFYTSLNNIRVIKSMKMKWVGYVARMGHEKCKKKIWLENPKGRNHSEDICVGGKIILSWILGKYCVKLWSGFT
jgi:hypothetical protein